jgi:hypothetical protein
MDAAAHRRIALESRLENAEALGLSDHEIAVITAELSGNPVLVESGEVQHVGGGWYQVGDQKVQGREAAEALLEEE